jgi:hypothetical protein
MVLKADKELKSAYLVEITAQKALKCVSIVSRCSFTTNIIVKVHVLPIKPCFETPIAMSPFLIPLSSSTDLYKPL